ncbi:MAG TPA: hypothetical protein VNO26_13760 [Candidatus Limnocylindria bacterium]|nr:hypothetical protein [Candidatus Limnocylindria bacterium]
MRRAMGAAIVAALTIGCGTQRPVLYLGDRPTAAAREAGERDIDACLAIGEQYRIGSGHGADVARNTAAGGAAGGAAGAAGGAIGGGSPGRGAATGAAVGAVWAFMNGILRKKPPDPGFRGAVDRCLADRGQRVIAWK